MTVQTGQPTESRGGQIKPDLVDRLQEVLSDWITGKTDSDETGIKCGQLVRQAMNEAGVHDGRPSLDNLTRVTPASDDNEQAVKIRTVALECIAFAAMRRTLRGLRFDDGSELMDYFRHELYGDWTGLVETSKGIARLVLEVDKDDNTDYHDDDKEFLKTLFKPFLALAARAQERTHQIGG